MESNRESKIILKSALFKEEDIKFKFALKGDFGKAQCAERMGKVKALGIENPNNAVVVTHEFLTEEAAQACVLQIEGLKLMIPKGDMLESSKAVGKTAVFCIRLPTMKCHEEIVKALEGMPGGIAAGHQSVEFSISGSKSLKEVLLHSTDSPFAIALESMCVKLIVSHHKDLFSVISELCSKCCSGKECCGSASFCKYASMFHHLNLEIDLREASEHLKTAFREEALQHVSAAGCMFLAAIDQFGFSGVVKSVGPQTTVLACLSPYFSAEVTVLAPTLMESFAALDPKHTCA